MEFKNGNEFLCPTIDLDRSVGLGRTYDELSRLLEAENDPNKVYEAHGDELLNVLRDNSPDVLAALIEGQQELDQGEGFLVVKGTRVDSLQPELAQLAAITLGSVYGRPTKTDQRKAQIAWPVTYDPNAGVRTTFSQTMSEATYHTDTQYFEKPERYFGLFCVVADIPGKGTNTLVNGQDVARRVEQELPEVGAALRKNYPFRVPTVFTKTGRDEDVEITWAPIVSPDGTIRYRRDTLLEAGSLPGVELSDAQVNAVQVFEEYLAAARVHEYHLQPGEAVFVNNHHLLHARTPYDNPARLLYRVRMEAVS